MGSLSMCRVVGTRTVQIFLPEGADTAKIYIVDDECGSRQPRSVNVRAYLDSGMTEEEVVRHVLNVVSASLEQVVQLNAH
ncbi:hypothetical protein WI41_22005 [Burkholderia latens]|uniref:Uncharacterized protein n=1 Tax=Burkholderia latens TaxID=488446 RepID=A0AAP1G712_9BURK|nr:hypothetical protein [Burkholderia latens]MBR7959915.1 hypothetical protein [Burkholderia vietnamiensis]KVA04751.1 hypothetical protein WI41_22005 [Burkholderia latens]MBY4692823.1 hypothetical protein [Burkholderia latens]QTO46637.1 hypothetical protein J8I85_19635 [Burkholderia latens]QTO50738.1 hypothetical protein J8I86_24785 [Burkholderia latens]